MHRLRIFLFALSTPLGMAALAPPAVASPRGDKLHKQALAAAEAGSYLKAKKLWQEAYQLDKEPKYLYNLGVIAEESDKPVVALGQYERFLKEAPDKPAYRALRTKAKARVAALLQRVAILEVAAEQPGVKVFVDQRAVGTGPLKHSVRVAPGEHLVVASLAGHLSQTHNLKLKAGERRKVVLRLKKIEAAKSTMRYPMPRWLPWTLLGGGVAIALAGIIPMAMQVKAYDDYDDSIDPVLLPKGDLDLKRRADAIYGAGIALLAVGGAVAVAGVITILLNRPKLVTEKPEYKAGVIQTLVGPGSVALRVRF